MISFSRWKSCKSFNSFTDSGMVVALVGVTPHSSSSLPAVLALLRLRPLGRQKVAVVSLSRPPVSKDECSARCPCRSCARR